MGRRHLFALTLAIAVFALPVPALADGALPTLVIAFPGMAFLFIPIVLIEALVLARILSLGWRRSLVVATASNAVTTVLGVPVAGVIAAVVSVVVEFGVAGAILLFKFDPSSFPAWLSSSLDAVFSMGWLTNPERGTIQHQMVVALALLIVPFFLMSWWVETLVSVRMLEGFERSLISRAVLIGNVLSYLLIALVLAVASVTFGR